jgi:hypothetical protein
MAPTLCGPASSPRPCWPASARRGSPGHTGHRDMNVLRLYYRNGLVFKGNPAKEIGCDA